MRPPSQVPATLAPEGEQDAFDAPTLTPADRQQLTEWNQTRADFPADRCIHELFEMQVERTPDAAAVILPDASAPVDGPGAPPQVLTYRELNRRANQLARYLQRLGVGPEVRVGICLERSPELIIAVLAVLKAGGAYVPLDPGYPAKRLALVLEDVLPPVLLTQARLLTRLPPHTAKTICLDSDWSAVAAENAENPRAPVAPENLAYVIYTSGSTGIPKGVMIEHRSVVNYITAMGRTFALEPGDRALQFASISFDAAVEEIFTALTRGATLVLRVDSMLASVELFLRRCDEWALTVVDLPTAYWHEVAMRLESDALTIPPAVRLIIIGGEKAQPLRLAEWRKHVGSRVRLLNTYGPTETTIGATVCDLSRNASQADLHAVPIGRPVANLQVHVLDARLRPVPIGAPGELHIGGAALARGYHNRPELTAEKFIPDPFSTTATPGARLYKTGDLVRFRADGDLEFVGRVDHQIKLRGFRIELGEIESALRKYPGIRDVVVVLREDRGREPALVAYVEPAEKRAPTASQLRAFLREQLPEHMVPAVFVLLPLLPRQLSGKVDPDALPLPPRTRDASGAEYTSPRTGLEETLCRLFSKLLGIDDVGAEDSFFALGGHSLLAARLIAEIRQHVGVDVPLLDVFEQPTPAGLGVLIDRRRSGERGRRLPPVERAPRTGELPLSFSQEPIWFLRQLEGDNLAYNAQWGVRFKGRLDLVILERALNEIVRRHEVLRTTFPARNGRPVQEIHQVFKITLPLVDFSHLPPDEAAAQAERQVAEECRRRFDITRLPLVQWTVIRLNPTEHVLVQAEQHFVHDGWSIAILLRELVALYDAFVRGKPSPLPEMSVQFADYAVWQRKSLQGEHLADLLAYWRRQLTGAPPLLNLPTDRPRPRMQTFRGAAVTRDVDPALSEEVRAFGRREGLTPFMVMLAAFKAMLSRSSGTTDVVVATTVANRPVRELEEVIGMFVNAVVLRTDYAGDPDFRELTRRVRKTALTAYAHQELPFEKLVEHLAPQRDSAYNPLFQVMFSFHDAPVPDLVLPELEGRVEYLNNGSAKVDINVVVIARNEQRVGLPGDAARETVSVEFEYNSDLFDAATINGMFDHFEHLLASAVRNPAQRLSELPFVTEPEQRALVGWNETAAEYPDDRCLLDLIHDAVQGDLNAPAIAGSGVTLTYAQLWQRVDTWARRLRQRGAGPGTRVAVCMERSVDMVVALLATLRTGAAYVPLDPTHPAQRIRYELEDAGVALVVTQQALQATLPLAGIEVACIDEALDTSLAAPDDVPLPTVKPDATAYVIYTSGSTGKPKGVQVSHRALVNLLWSMARRLQVGKRDRCLAITTIAFDIAGLELYLPLLIGGRLDVVPSPIAADGRLLARAIVESQPTFMQATPATWRMLLQAGWPGNPELKILCGGEAMPTDLARALLPRCQALFNMYGPTETTIWSAIHKVQPDDDPVPIGRPIDNTAIYILDSNRRLVPVGVPGELYIGGDGVAQGYLGRPELTAERFVVDPLDPMSRRMFYRTGDLARRRWDGSVEYLGRIDSQVKLRGFRIELEEIEAVLREHPDVRDCAAAVREYSADDRRLAAFVVAAPGTTPDAAALKAFLATRLPEYMLPAAFVTVERLPLNPSGKLDRKALPAVDFTPTAHQDEDAVPQTPMEFSLAALWQTALGTERVGRNDNFFDLGGHSLLSMQLIAKIADEHGVWLSPRDFMLQNLSQLAAVCDARVAAAATATPRKGTLDNPLLQRLRGFA